MEAGRLKAIDPESVEGSKMVYIDEYFQKYVNPMVALRELYELLEAYSPTWYTRETRVLARAALQEWPQR
jgi:hypothetical protein